MNNFYSKNFQNFCTQKRYYGSMFLIPPENYMEFLKEVYAKFKNTKGLKSLYELKRLALREAQKATSGMIFKDNTNSSTKKITKEDLIKIFKAVYDVINPILVKINHNFKNERRKNYEDNKKYLSIIKTFEQQKSNLITFTIRSICKAMKIKISHLQEKIAFSIQSNDQEVIGVLNSFVKIGKMFALAPKNLTIDEVKEMLRTYLDNLNYLINNSQSDKKNLKFSLVFINDIIYENFGLEEEQIFAFIQEKNLSENKEIGDLLKAIQDLIIRNFSNLFDI